MKYLNFCLTALSLFIAIPTLADQAYEDSPEFLQEFPEEAPNKGTWAFKFVLLKNDGTSETLSEYRAQQAMKPASTVKLFTGWMGFSKRVKSIDFLAQMLQTSDNAKANQTLAKMGGIQKMVQFFKSLDLPVTSSTFKLMDGSGLDHSNRVTVDLEIELLSHIRQSTHYQSFKTLLAQPGEDGTLRNRLLELDDPLYGKTGTLRDTAALAGFIELDRGTLIFSIIANHLEYQTIKRKGRSEIIPTGVYQARSIIDEMVREHLKSIRSFPFRD